MTWRAIRARPYVRVSQQLHAVRASVNKENVELVLTWLAFHAKNSEKSAFFETLVQSREYMAEVGGKKAGAASYCPPHHCSAC